MHKVKLPENVTSYDLLKTVAVILMVVDHLGYFFFPEQLWLRLLGRMCVPMWFFLIGYARSRDLPLLLWAGAAALVASDSLAGISIFPLNILFTIIFIRLSLDYVITKMLSSRLQLLIFAFAIIVLYIPTTVLFEYGTSGLALAFIGYLARHRKELALSRYEAMIWTSVIALFFVITQYYYIFPFPPVYGVILLLSIVAICLFLYCRFTPMTFAFRSRILSFFGRYTLGVYVGHIILFTYILVFYIW